MSSSGQPSNNPPKAVKSWPAWQQNPTNRETVKAAISSLFWQSLAEAITQLMSDTIDVAHRAGINVLALARKAKPVSPGPYNPTEEEKAFVHVARCLLQGAGLFDVDILLEDRGIGDRIGLPLDALDWLFTRDLLRFSTRGILRWGNAHASILWGPLKFETGIKTESKQVDGILVTARFNPVKKRPALRLTPIDSSVRLDTADLDDMPPDTVSGIPPSRPFALIKEIVDALFIQINNRDVYTEGILDTFVYRTLLLHKNKVVDGMSPTKLGEKRREAVENITNTWKNYKDTKAFEKLVLDQTGAFVDLVWNDSDIARWTGLFRNCQHFCAGILQSKCFLRVDGYDKAGLPKTPSEPGDKKYESALPSIQKVFPLVDERKPQITPIFKEYFDSVTRSSEGATMVSFKEEELQETLRLPPKKASLLDMREFGIPTLPGTIEYSKTNERLGLLPDEPNDAWFAISTATLYFVTPTDPTREITQKLESMTRPYTLGVLGLGMLEWLEKAADPRLLNSIMFDALTLLTQKERQDLYEDAVYVKMVQEAEAELAKQREPVKREKLRQRELAIKASRKYLVDIPRLRARQRGSWDFLTRFLQ